MRINFRYCRSIFSLDFFPNFMSNIITINLVLILVSIYLTTEDDYHRFIEYCWVAFDFQEMPIDLVRQLFPTELRILISKINAVKIGKNPLLRIIPSMNIHNISKKYRYMVRSSFDIFTDLDLRPPRVKSCF